MVSELMQSLKLTTPLHTEKHSSNRLTSSAPSSVLSSFSVSVTTTPTELSCRATNVQGQSFTRLLAPNGTIAQGKLYGRQREEQQLLRAYQNACCCDGQQDAPVEIRNQNRLVVITGTPGSGKTALATTLSDQVVLQDRGFFVVGKFEQMVRLEPYDVFVSALTDYTNQLIDRSSQDLIQRVRSAALEAVGDEAGLLTGMVPALERLLGKHEEPSRVYGSKATNRFRFVFSNFVRALTKCSPLVMLLDDLQWADTASLELIRSLLETPNMSLLLVGTHRSSNSTDLAELGACPELYKDNGSAFMSMMLDVTADKENRLKMTEIHLESISVSDTQTMLADLLKQPTADTKCLAEAVHEHAKGNVFHILQFVRILVDQGLLTRHDENGPWVLDDAAILDEMVFEETITDLVRQSIFRLPRLLQVALKLASCMPDPIDDSALDLLLQTRLGSLLDQAVTEGLLVFVPSTGGYRFAHDLVRQTVFDLVPEDEREELYFTIGKKLYTSSSSAARENNIFTIVGLLNKGSNLILDEVERYKVAELNLRAGEKAAKVSAFTDASRFLHHGISLLGPNRWTDEYDLTLALYNAAAEVEVIRFDCEQASSLIEDVLEHGRCLEDKLRAYWALMRSKGQQDSMNEVVSIASDVLRQLGEPLPAKASRVVVMNEFVKAKLALRGKSCEDLLNLPPMTDESKKACMLFLTLMFGYLYRARSPYAGVVGFRAVQLTLKYGLHFGSVIAFNVYGMMVCALGARSDVKEGQRFGQLAISLAEKLQSREALPRAYFMSCGIRHWSEPIKETLDDLLYASKIAREVCDLETHLVAQQAYSVYSLFLGTSIADVEKRLLVNVQQAKQYKFASDEMMGNMTLQLLHCLTGRAENPARLSGSVIDFYETMAKCEETELHSYIVCLNWYAMELAYMHGDYKYAGLIAERNRTATKFPGLLFAAVKIRFVEGLIAIALARQGIQRRANMRIAKESLKKFSKWAKDSPRSYLGKYKILEAELLSLNKCENASAVYVEAIELATKEEYTTDMALAYELAGDYKHSKGDDKLAVFYWNRSVKYYGEWGATAKVQQMRNRDSTGSVSTHSASLEYFIE